MSETKLHYNKKALLDDYQATYGIFMKTLMIGIGGALVYFFIFVVYLGGWSHTPAADYVHTFGSRIQYDYSGQKLPMYEDPAKAEKFLKKTATQQETTHQE